MFWDVVLLVAALAVLLPTGVVCLEICAALLPVAGRRPRGEETPRPCVAVLIPAHDEATVIGDTLAALGGQLAPGDRLVVVADNCGDQTAQIAASAGAEVCRRDEPDRRGKGFALEFGLRHLETDPPDVVVFIDADCIAQPHAVDLLSRPAAATRRPVQASYLLAPPQDAGPRQLLASLAFLVKNLVRPWGLHRLGLPCLLTGSGMAFPWPAIRSIDVGSGAIVEDMQFAVDLALAGFAPRFCRRAEVHGRFPADERAARGQRTRWEHGHLATLLTQGPRLCRAAFGQRRPKLLALMGELAVPPLALLVLLSVAMLTLTIVAGLAGAAWLPARLILFGLLLLGAAVVATWARFGRRFLPGRALLAAPFYVLGKIPLYFRFLVRRQKEWVRTQRDTEPLSIDSLRTIELYGAQLHGITEPQCIELILDEIDRGAGGSVVTMNLDHLRRYARHDSYKQLCRQARLVVADGMPLVWASRLQGTPLPVRVAGSNLVETLSAGAAGRGRSVFLLGGDPGMAEASAENLGRELPGLRVAGTYFPEFGFEQDALQLQRLVTALQTAQPDIVFVALGSPKQEQLIADLRHVLPAAWWLGVGISFSFVGGEISRAPGWMQRGGLEWLHRLYQEPRRLAGRYLLQGLPFVLRLFGSVLWQRLRGKSNR